MRLQNPLLAVEPSAVLAKPFTSARDGFSLNCAVGCEPNERAKLERVCRYMARGPIAEQRLSVDGDGLVVLELKRAFSDGTTHVLFEPADFIARLAALVPRPRAHLVRYFGVFAPNAPQRRLIVTAHSVRTASLADDDTEPSARTAPMSWMARLQRVFAVDISRCPRCGAKVRVMAIVTEPNLIARILDHLSRRDHDPPACAPASLLG